MPIFESVNKNKGKTYLFNRVPAKAPRGVVSRTSEARDGFQELQDGFRRFLKRHPLGANFGE